MHDGRTPPPDRSALNKRFVTRLSASATRRAIGPTEMTLLARTQILRTDPGITFGGVPIVEGEQIVGVVYGAEGQIGRMALPKLYDLVFTDRRLVGIVTVKMGTARLAGQLLGGVIGQAIAASVAKGGADKKRMAYAGMPLDQVVAQDSANFAVPYDLIENPQIKGVFSKRLDMRVRGKRSVFRLPQDYVPQTEALINRLFPVSNR